MLVRTMCVILNANSFLFLIIFGAAIFYSTLVSVYSVLCHSFDKKVEQYYLHQNEPVNVKDVETPK